MFEQHGKQSIDSAKIEWQVFLANRSRTMDSVGKALSPIVYLQGITVAEEILGPSAYAKEAEELLMQWAPVIAEQVVQSFAACDERREEEYRDSASDGNRAKTARLALNEMGLYPSWENEWKHVPEPARSYVEGILSKWKSRYEEHKESDLLTPLQQLERARSGISESYSQVDRGEPIPSLHYRLSPKEIAEWEACVYSTGILEPSLYSSAVTLVWSVRGSTNRLRVVSAYMHSCARFRECVIRASNLSDRRLVDAMEASCAKCSPVAVEQILNNLREYSQARRDVLARIKSVGRQLISARKTLADLEKCFRYADVLPTVCDKEVKNIHQYWRDQVLILDQA